MIPYLVFSGSQSVGKTSTVEAVIPVLEDFYKLPVYYIKEVSRKLKANLNVIINEEGTGTTQRMIESMYKQEEDDHENVVRVADRSIIDRFSYTLHSKAAEDIEIVKWYESNLESICRKYTHIFYIPLTSELQLELDGVRSSDEEFRKKIDSAQADIIKKYNIPVHILSGTTAQRIEQITRVLR